MLKRILITLIVSSSLFLAASVRSVDTAPPSAAKNAPSDASINQLLETANAHKLVDSMMGQMDSIMKNALQMATQGQPVSPEIQRTFDKTRTEIVTIMKEEFTWEKLEPIYLRIYKKSFTQEEVDGMIAFYKTPAGQAVINKMPVVMQNTMAEMQAMMGPMMQRIQNMQSEVVAQVAAEKKKKAGGG
jgi:hypothetical protein